MDLEKAIGRLQRIRGDWGGLLDEWRFSRNERVAACCFPDGNRTHKQEKNITWGVALCVETAFIQSC